MARPVFVRLSVRLGSTEDRTETGPSVWWFTTRVMASRKGGPRMPRHRGRIGPNGLRDSGRTGDTGFDWYTVSGVYRGDGLCTCSHPVAAGTAPSPLLVGALRLPAPDFLSPPTIPLAGRLLFGSPTGGGTAPVGYLVTGPWFIHSFIGSLVLPFGTTQHPNRSRRSSAVGKLLGRFSYGSRCA